MFKILFTSFLSLLIGCCALTAVGETPEYRTRILARGAPIQGGNGMKFDDDDRLLIASATGRNITVMNARTGRILDQIGPERGVETPDDVAIGPDGSIGPRSLLVKSVVYFPTARPRRWLSCR